MVKRPNEDLFAESTMTFGEHLEELRVVLAKAVFGLMLGFIAGLCVANYVIGWIQEPLRRSLEDHYIVQAMERLTTEYRNEGKEMPPGVEAYIRRNRVVYENMYVEAGEIKRLQKLLDEQPAPTAEGTAAEAEPAPAAEDAAAETQPTPGTPPLPTGGAETVPVAAHAPDTQLLATRIWKPINAVVRSLSARRRS